MTLPGVRLTSKVQTKGPDDQRILEENFWVDKDDGSNRILITGRNNKVHF